MHEQVQLSAGTQVAAARSFQNGPCIDRSEAGADEYGVNAVLQQFGRKSTADETGGRNCVLQRCQLRRRGAGVGHSDVRAATGAPPCHSQARAAQAQNQNVLLVQAAHLAHLSFSVARPARHSSMVMIQKRITTWVSRQPFFSKWWCSGAILNRRRPVP